MTNVNVAASTGFHLEKMDKGGKIMLRGNFGGTKEVRATVHPLGESRGMPPRKVLNFRPSAIASDTFSDHLWFSNDMEQKE